MQSRVSGCMNSANAGDIRIYAFQRRTLKHSLPNLPQQQKLLRLVQDGQQGAHQILNHTLN